MAWWLLMDAYLPHDFPRPVAFSPDAQRRIAAGFNGQRGQSKLSSAIEIMISTAVGFLVSLAIGYWLFPKMFHTDVSHETNIVITAIFTGVSLARGYVMRRVFNWWHCRFG